MLEGGQRVDVDIYCPNSGEGPDLIVEVKDKQQTGKAEIDTFAALKQKLEPHLQRPTHFLFYSEIPLSEEHQTYALDQGLLYSDGQRLAAY